MKLVQDDHFLTQHFLENNCSTHDFITGLDDDTLKLCMSQFATFVKETGDETTPDSQDLVNLTLHMLSKEIGESVENILLTPIDEVWYKYNLSKLALSLDTSFILEDMRRKGIVEMNGKYTLTGNPSFKLTEFGKLVHKEVNGVI